MSLTMGRGPFGDQPAGTLNFVPPEVVVLVDPFPRRVRGMIGDETVIDSEAVRLVHVTRHLPYFAFPRDDVRIEAEPDEHVEGYVRVAWNAVEAWFEEDEQVFVHPRDPYHRIDTFRTSRTVRVSLDGELLAESTSALALYETGLPIRWYLPVGDVRVELLEPSPTVTQCAYKGAARHWSARTGGRLSPDVAWSYESDVGREAEAVSGRICFYNERVDLELDGRPETRPQTPWSR